MLTELEHLQRSKDCQSIGKSYDIDIPKVSIHSRKLRGITEFPLRDALPLIQA